MYVYIIVLVNTQAQGNWNADLGYTIGSISELQWYRKKSLKPNVAYKMVL